MNQRQLIVHPSQQSAFRPFKPSIRVGYQNIPSQQLQTRRYKKPVMIIKHTMKEERGVKKTNTNNLQIQSGTFIDSQYVPNHHNKSEANYHKKGVTEVQSRVHGSRQFSQQLKQQFIVRSKSTKAIGETPSLTQRSKLSSYKNQGIKDILEYKHAGNYRQSKLASKCTNESASNRCLSYHALHELDFRKLRPMLR